MLKYAAGLALFVGLSVPVRAGELDNEQPAQTTPAAVVRHAPATDLKSAVSGSEMDREAFRQDWGRWRSWGWGFGGWGFGGWGCYRPWVYSSWGWGFPAYGFGWGCYPAFGWGGRFGCCW
ncbi:MAG: hypothetical protein U0746_20580 [Gemmataceae bacterium]